MAASSKKYYVYGLFRPDTCSIFYIGMGQEQRAWWHQTYRKRGRSHKDNIICKVIDDLGYSECPVVIIKDELTKQEAIDLEIALIYAVGRHPNGPLVNKTAGGDGSLDPTDELRKKLSISHLGKKASEETRNKQSMALKGKLPVGQKSAAASLLGKPKSEETKQKIANKLTGRKQDPEVVARRAVTISKVKTGRKQGPHSSKHTENIRQGLLLAYAEGRRPKTSGMKGKRHSEETKKKMSLSATARVTDEQRERMRLLAPIGLKAQRGS